MLFDYIELPACGFCGGPPMLDEAQGDQGEFRAFVSCHECGARGPVAEDYDVQPGSAEWVKVIYHAIQGWTQRDNRNADLIERDLCQIRIDPIRGEVTRMREDREKN